jgi:hypothetical protein
LHNHNKKISQLNFNEFGLLSKFFPKKICAFCGGRRTLCKRTKNQSTKKNFALNLLLSIEFLLLQDLLIYHNLKCVLYCVILVFWRSVSLNIFVSKILFCTLIFCPFTQSSTTTAKGANLLREKFRKQTKLIKI